ncbi:MAG: hypothetical protein AAF843_02240 [Bacteroidota bacterium]
MEQYVGDGASLFITIVACLAGFGAAVGLLDFQSTKKKETDNESAE